MQSDAEMEREVTQALKKHLRDGHLAAALAWLRARVDAYKALERLN